jgi:uncharacterized membrane protein YdbT with pleckstrin-like domain
MSDTLSASAYLVVLFSLVIAIVVLSSYGTPERRWPTVGAVLCALALILVGIGGTA